MSVEVPPGPTEGAIANRDKRIFDLRILAMGIVVHKDAISQIVKRMQQGWSEKTRLQGIGQDNLSEGERILLG